MNIEKSKIVEKLSKLKSLTTSKATGGSEGILLQNNCLVANNGEITVMAKLDIVTMETFVIPRLAIDMIGNLPAGDIEITEKDGFIHMKSGSIKNKCATISADTFPKISAIGTTTSEAKIDGKVLLDSLNSVSYAAAGNDSKPTFAGVLLEAADNNLNLVALDGFRSSWNKTPYEANFKVIIPQNTVKKLIDLELSGDVRLAWNENSIVFKNAEYGVHSKVISGEFFDYPKIYTQSENSGKFNKKAIAEAISRAMLCIGPTDKKALILSFSGNKLTISTKQSVSEYEETIELSEAVKEDITIGISGKFLLDAIKSFPDGTIDVQLRTPVDPLTMSNSALTALVLPVRL